MANTYEAIATVTVGSGGAADIQFTSIAADWTDLCLKVSARNTSSGDYILLSFNGSSSSFTQRAIYGNGTTAASFSDAPRYGGAIDTSSQTASTFGNVEIYIPNYAGSSNKSHSIDSVMENNGTTAYTNLNAGLWSNAAAITSITLAPSENNFAQYSTATLYGIKNS